MCNSYPLSSKSLLYSAGFCVVSKSFDNEHFFLGFKVINTTFGEIRFTKTRTEALLASAIIRGGSRAAVISQMERSVIIVNSQRALS